MEFFDNFHFLRPAYLLMLLPGVVLGVMLWRQRGREASWSRVVSPELLPHLISSHSVRRSRAGIPALLLAWCLASLAAAGPSWQQLPQPVLQKQDALVLVMDLSYSMLATDLQPSRQDRVRRKLLDLLRDRREGLTALIAYAGDAHIVAPLTDDNPTIANLLPALNPGMMPLPGSNPVEAVERALALLDSAGVRQGRILVVTDGITDRDSEALIKLMADQPRQLALLGVGTDVGAPIALPGGGFLRSEEGELIVPKLDEAPLSRLAASSGGRYRSMSVDDSDLKALLAENFVVDEDDTISLDRRADRWQDMGYWLVLPLLVLTLGSFRRGLIYSLPLALLLPPDSAQALEWQDLWLRKDQQGQQALQAGDPERAAGLFEDSRWKGTAAYTAEDYETAEEAFAVDESADGWYNRGSALAAAGNYDDAISAYEKSLELQPDQEDAQKNIETLKRVQEQQQQQQSQQGDPNQQPQNDDQSQDQQQGDSGQQEQPSGNSEQQSQDQNQEQQSQDQSNQQGQDGSQEQDQQSSSEGQEPQEDSGSQGEEEQSEQQAGGQPMPQPDIDTSAMQEDLERDQAMQQWLRRVPDDPSGLLREKFRYESRLRQQQGESRASKQIW